jgi:hypothetical protein
MTKEEFVERMYQKAVMLGVKGCIKQLESPSGRKPHPAHIEESKWFNRLKDADKLFVERCMTRAAEMTLFSVFTVLDGEGFIEDAGPKGEFKLLFEKDGKSVLLNPPSGTMLHDLMPRARES